MNNIVQDFVEFDDLIDFGMPILMNIDESYLEVVSVTERNVLEEERECSVIEGHPSVSEPVAYPAGKEPVGSKPVPKKRKREHKTNKKQFEALISFFNENADFPKGRTKVSEAVMQAFEALVPRLNSMGPPTKSSEGWRKVWSDYKAQNKRSTSVQETTSVPEAASAPEATSVPVVDVADCSSALLKNTVAQLNLLGPLALLQLKNCGGDTSAKGAIEEQLIAMNKCIASISTLSKHLT